MANPKHLAKLKEGTKRWNSWRKQNPKVHPDLCNADMSGAHLTGPGSIKIKDVLDPTFEHGVNLRGANLRGANLFRAELHNAYLSGADLSGANLTGTGLIEADLNGAKLRGAELGDANLWHADLSGADLSGADLSGAMLLEADLHLATLEGASLNQAHLVKTNLQGANLTNCSVYGISVWDVKLEGAIQSNLVINPYGESPIQVDNLEIAQFIYLLLNNEKIRSVIDTITSKVVLILGRFTPDRKVVLDAIRDELRKKNYVPVLFDFEKPSSKDLTGTITTLANMARFIIADLTDPNSVPHELATVIPNTVVPIQAIILAGRRAYPMFDDLRKRHRWVLKPYRYRSRDRLIADLSKRVIAPAEAKARALAGKKKK